MRRAATIVLAFAAFSLCASAQTTQPSTAPQEEASLHGYGDTEKTCQEWTDGCRICIRPESGEALCSNIGIACQPKAISCTKRLEEQK